MLFVELLAYSKRSQSFTAYYLSGCSLKNSHTGHPTGTEACIWIYNKGRDGERKDQSALFIKLNVKSKLTRQEMNGSIRLC